MGRARTSSGEWTLWVVALSCALHATEEFFTGWQPWARETLGILMPTTVFLGMNAVLVIAALLLAPIGWQRPALTLVIPVATFVNAVCFHILPTVLTGHVSPGLYTATVLYLPFSSWAVVAAARHGAPRTALRTALLVGATMAIGVVIAARWLGGAGDVEGQASLCAPPNVRCG